MAKRSRGALPLVTIVLVAAVGVGVVVAKGWSPALGLDLQGGVSVVYQAANDVPDDSLDDAIEIIRSRVDALGVAEPEILRQGDSIVVNLPGVADRERALEVIGRTAELRFRPVLTAVPYATAEEADDLVPSTSSTSSTTSTTAAPGGQEAPTTSTTAPAETTSTSEAALDDPAGLPAGLPAGRSAGLSEGEFAAALPAQDPTTTTTTAPGATTTATTTTAPGATTTTTAPAIAPDDGCFLLGGTTPRDEDTPEATVVLPDKDPDPDEEAAPQRQCYQLGPVPTDGENSLVGSIVSNPTAQITQGGEWVVALDIDGDALDLFNQTAAQCVSRDAICPTGQLAIVLDGEVQSAPVIQEPSFAGGAVSISGSFTQQQAEDLELILRFGALPVELEVQTVQSVSATLGEDSLRAGLVAGFIGVALVILYLFAYYRALGLVVVAGTVVWSALNFAVIAWLGETQGLALSLAGVTGIVISIGVTVDSYVVYFERLKDEIRTGRTLRSSIDRGFERAFRTILAANISSLIGAGLLYILTVGPVRGFAFFLGLSTILGLLVAYFFTRPLVAVLGRSRFFTTNRVFGVGRGLGVEEATT